MKKILILTADFGFGHRSAANAIATGLRSAYGAACSVDVLNPLEDPQAPALLRDDQHAYDRLVREAPDLYRLGYKVGETWVASHLVEGSFTLGLFNVMRDLLRQRQPDIIVTTYLFYQGILSAVFAAEGRRLPVVTVVTDLSHVNRMWFHTVADMCLVPTQAVYEQALAAGLSPERVRNTGLPVRPDLAAESREPASLRAELGWTADKFTVLAIGSKRVGHMEQALQSLNHSGWPLQLVAVAGGDPILLQHLQVIDWHVDTYVYGYVEQMGTFLRAADCVLSKAGGLTVAESLACGRPLILVDVIQGQETGNADYVTSGGAGVLAPSPLAVLESVAHWLEKDRQLYLQYADRARRLGRPRAATEAAKLIWAAG
jgi:1,2-diacylglycerol 3-beta-galactosyltransferase